MSDQIGLAELGQISMRALDVPRAVAFYRNVLGVPFLFDITDPPMGFFDLEGVRLMLAKPSGEHDHPGSILYFRVDDIESTHETLVVRGVSFDQGPHMIADMGEYELWIAFFKDSEANQLALMSEVTKA